MIVPEFWAEASRQHRERGRQVTIRRFGWSDRNIGEAEAMAAQRAEDALGRFLRGEKLPRREPRVAYNGAEGVPIREEVLARHGEEVITRNAYGARCLNTPRALFADVDFDAPVPGRWYLASVALSLAVALAVGLVWRNWLVAAGIGLVLLLLTGTIVSTFGKAVRATGPGAEAIARQKLLDFVAAHPEWSVRVYRTPAGLRLLATHRPFTPDEPQAQAFFHAISADPLYVRMCNNQKCFRARLTAKPWRIGMPDHMKPRPGVWPVADARLSERRDWIRRYEDAARGYAACRFVETLGSGAAHTDLQSVIALHDAESRALDTQAQVA